MKIIILAPFFTLLILFGLFDYITKKKGNETMKICFDSPWKNLHPGTQNTLIGGLIISQQFESLIKIDSDGNIAPSIAKNWEISSDFKSIRFFLDPFKKFRNGKTITTDDVFNSWVSSFKMSADNPNNSLKDVLYNVVGFDLNKKIDEIPGFNKINESTFELIFNKPFRMAIFHLRGARFAIYSHEENSIIGSGKYTYDVNDTGDKLQLINNQSNQRIEVFYNQGSKDLSELDVESCDIYYAPSGYNQLSELDENFNYVTSEDAVHLTFFLNTKKGLFSDKKMRLAFQYLIHQNKDVSSFFTQNLITSTSDPQIFNSFSQGRLDENEAQAIIDEGKIYVEDFITRIKKNKLGFFVVKNGFLSEAFSKINIREFISEIKEDPKKIFSDIYKGKLELDFINGFLSVLSYDPDGIYHALGRNGAILNPYMANEKLFELLESGREITDRSKIDEHYKEVSRIFLREVPFIHLGFSKNVLIYNKNKVKIGKDSFRNSLDFSNIEAL